MRGPVTGLFAGVLTALALIASTGAEAQAWPSRPVRIIVPFPPGGGLDFFAPNLAPKRTARLGPHMGVENRSGAGGVVGG